MTALAMTRTDLDAADLRHAAARSRDAAASRRILALALVLEGKTQSQAANAAGINRQTLRDWVRRYNQQGLPGLSNKVGKVGLKPRLSPAQKAKAGKAGARGPEPGRAQRGRGAAAAWGPPADRAPAPSQCRCFGANVFQAAFHGFVAAAPPEVARGKTLEIWWQDEARVGQQGTLTRMRARLAEGSDRRSRMEWQSEGERGSRPTALWN